MTSTDYCRAILFAALAACVTPGTHHGDTHPRAADPQPADTPDVRASGSASLSIAVEIAGSAKAMAMAGDRAFAAGDYEAALAAYGEGFARSRHAAFLYGQAQCHKAMESSADARALFSMYLAAPAEAQIKHRAEAEAETGAGAEGSSRGAIGGLGSAATGLVKGVTGGVFSAAEVTIGGSIKGSAAAAARAGDQAYAAGKYWEAARSYTEAYAQSEAHLALYAAAQARAQAGDAAAARAMLAGYLQAARDDATHAKSAQQTYLAMGGTAAARARVAVTGEVSSAARSDAEAGDQAYAAGKYLAAAKLYGRAYGETSDAAALYARGRAQYCAGQTAEAVKTMRSYLAASGRLAFEAEARATIRAAGGS